ncbi:MAG: hypothetical protein AAFR87_32165, partial [Bacteroidota bacterium]
ILSSIIANIFRFCQIKEQVDYWKLNLIPGLPGSQSPPDYPHLMVNKEENQEEIEILEVLELD